MPTPSYHIRQTPDVYGYQAQSASYHFSWSYDYVWINKPVTVLREVPMAGGVLKVTDHKLLIEYKHQIHSFDYQELTHISLQRKKLTLPILVGGIVAPLAMIAMMNRLLDRFFAISIAFVGAMLLYYGWRGGHELIITTQGQHQTRFIIDEIPEELPLAMQEIRKAMRVSQSR